MKRLVFATGSAAATCLCLLSPVFAQSNPTVQSDVIQHPATDFSSATAAISDNFRYMNHPPPPAAPASSPTSSGGRGHRHRQMSGGSDSGSGTSMQP